MSDQPESLRAALLDKAKGLVTKSRNQVYGPPHRDFSRSAGALNAYGYRGPDGRLLKAHDIAIIVDLVKTSRLVHSPDHEDSWVDKAGYAACGYECSQMEDK